MLAPTVSASDEARTEIRTMVAEAIVRFGIAGEVELAERLLVLRGPGPTSRVDLGGLPDSWGGLPYDERQKKATGLARQLVAQRRQSAAPVATTTRSGSSVAVIATVVLAAAAGGAYFVFFADRSTEETPVVRKPAPNVAPTSGVESDDREARARRVCDATRSRVMRGATVSKTDVEGWVVEITVLRNGGPEMTFDPALAQFVDRKPGQTSGRLVWKTDTFSEVDPFTRVTVADASPKLGDDAWRGVSLTLQGKYVSPFFENDTRIEYVRLGNALADRLGATHAALYARCAHGTQTHMGAWFFGKSLGGATLSLLYFMGTFADSPHISAAVLRPDGGPFDRANVLTALVEPTAPLDKRRVARWVGEQGGMVTAAETRSTIRFPFRDANRASRASRTIARALDVGSDR